MKSFGEILNYSIKFPFCCGRNLVLIAIYYVSMLMEPLIPFFSIVVHIFFVSLGLYVGKIMIETHDLEEFFDHYKKTPISKAIFSKVTNVLGLWLAILIFVVISIIFTFTLVRAFVDMGFETIGSILFIIILITVFYVYPYIVGKIIYKSKGFADAFKFGFTIVLPSTIKKLLIKEYFVLQLKYLGIAIIMIVVLVVIIFSSVFTLKIILGETGFILGTVINVTILNVVFFIMEIPFLNGFSALCYKVVEGKENRYLFSTNSSE